MLLLIGVMVVLVNLFGGVGFRVAVVVVVESLCRFQVSAWVTLQYRPTYPADERARGSDDRGSGDDGGVCDSGGGRDASGVA
jgi:hypothetical protein